MTQPLQQNLKGLPYAPAECIREQHQLDAVNAAIFAATRCLDSPSVVQTFLTTYRNWIKSTKLNQVIGLDSFIHAEFTQGTSESFDKFYARYHTSRFRCFRGEYMYHRLCWDNACPGQWEYFDETKPDLGLATGDAVVVSFPFADLGDPHPLFNNEFLDRCYSLNIPVLLDCAFFGITGNLTFDFTHPAIKEICFSLSKTFPVNLHRIGMRLSRTLPNDGITIYNNSQYVNKLSAAIGIEILNTKGPDDAFIKWRSKQIEFCNQFHLTPSNTVIFGIDYKHQYDHYNRGMPDTNRLCFSLYYETGNLITDAR